MFVGSGDLLFYDIASEQELEFPEDKQVFNMVAITDTLLYYTVEHQGSLWFLKASHLIYPRKMREAFTIKK